MRARLQPANLPGSKDSTNEHPNIRLYPRARSLRLALRVTPSMQSDEGGAADQDLAVEAGRRQLITSREGARVHVAAAVLVQQRRVVQRHALHQRRDVLHQHREPRRGLPRRCPGTHERHRNAIDIFLRSSA